MYNTLLALLLALKNLETPLSENERNKLVDIGKNLKENPNDQYVIKKELIGILKANDTLKQLYQEAKVKLDTVDRPISSDLLPTDAELENFLPLENKGGKRVYFEGEPDHESKEILNAVYSVLSTPEPEVIAKKLTGLEKLWQFLNQPILKND
ncbi:hypothetical protein [Okeania sp. SIO1I7]|uniref:hypothetical protein n=1 Tax=Okeania sp. SIO1I7 TaxID=2607772 RepID=UPI0013F91378|nr:hypothetical protein [Okeania sp. SIO1I7]NET27818.1 hypothetical protein [Okeania sp. SIO1I7]